VAILTYGEGFHNYHHVFPYDYKTAELGDYVFNPTTAFIDIFAKIGWAYSLKTVSGKTIKKRIARTGDGTHKCFGTNNSAKIGNGIIDNDYYSCKDYVWGWGDEDMTEEDCKSISVIEKAH
jgi:stearoyl-CoA desaturase (delta-9 desaturase)